MKDCHLKPTAGFVGFGEVNTPTELIVEKCKTAAEKLGKAGLELVMTAPVTDDPEGKDAARAAGELFKKDFDTLIICIAGWIPSWAVFAVIEKFRHKPMILLGLTGRETAGRFVTTADQAGTTALRKPMADMGYKFKYIISRYGKDLPAPDVMSFCSAASAAARLRKSKVCMAGFRDMHLYGTLYDAVSLKKHIGPEVKHFDLLELKQNMDAIAPETVKPYIGKMKTQWNFHSEPEQEALEKSIKLCLAIKHKIEESGADAFSYKDVDGIKKLMGFSPAGAMTLLHDEIDISSIPENDAPGAITQLMVRFLTGQAGAYLEFYEFTEGGALMGVPDYVPSEIVDGRVEILPTSFGAFGAGLLNVSKLKTGRATICRLSHTGDNYLLHMAAGEAKTPPAWEEAGWAPPAPQLPGLEFVFDGNAEDFIQNVTGQHYIICYGDILKQLNDLCCILNINPHIS